LTRKKGGKKLSESIKLYISARLSDEKVDFNLTRQHPPHHHWLVRLSFLLSARANNNSIFSSSECIKKRQDTTRCEKNYTNCRQCFCRKKHALLDRIASHTRFISQSLFYRKNSEWERKGGDENRNGNVCQSNDTDICLFSFNGIQGGDR
jgi:hypothetical protein